MCLHPWLGKESEHVFKTFEFDARGDENKFEAVLNKLDNYFVPKVNVIHERARFQLLCYMNIACYNWGIVVLSIFPFKSRQATCKSMWNVFIDISTDGCNV